MAPRVSPMSHTARQCSMAICASPRSHGAADDCLPGATSSPSWSEVDRVFADSIGIGIDSPAATCGYPFIEDRYSRVPLVVAFDQKSWLARPRCRHTASAFSHCNPPYVVAKRVCPLVCLNNSCFATLQNLKNGTVPAEARPDLLIRKVCLAQVSEIVIDDSDELCEVPDNLSELTCFKSSK